LLWYNDASSITTQRSVRSCVTHQCGWNVFCSKSVNANRLKRSMSQPIHTSVTNSFPGSFPCVRPASFGSELNVYPGQTTLGSVSMISYHRDLPIDQLAQQPQTSPSGWFEVLDRNAAGGRLFTPRRPIRKFIWPGARKRQGPTVRGGRRRRKAEKDRTLRRNEPAC
jgi:hypothetical protein